MLILFLSLSLLKVRWLYFGHVILQVIDYAHIKKRVVGIGHSFGVVATYVKTLP